MTANAFNTVAPNAAGAGPLGAKAAGVANAAGKASGPLAGFEALLAALFPAADPTAALPAAGVTPPGQATPGAAALVAADAAPSAKDGKDGKDDKSADLAASEPDAAAPAVADPNAALAACLLVTPTKLPEINLTLPKGAGSQDGASVGDALTGEAKPRTLGDRGVLVPFAAGPTVATAKGKLAAAPNAAAEPKAQVVGPASADGDLSLGDETPAVARTGAQPAGAKEPTATPAPQRPAGSLPPPAPAGPAAPPHARTAKTEAAAAAPPPTEAPAAPAPAPVPAAAAATVAPATTTETAVPVATAALATPPRTAAPPPAKGSKAERARETAETASVDGVAAPPAIGKPTNTSATAASPAASPAAKPAGAEVEAAEARKSEPQAAPDQPQPGAVADTHAPASSSAPVAHAAHVVRGSPETVANLAAQIVKKLEGQSSRFDVELDPIGLGKVNVRIEIGAQGAMSASMSFDNPQAAAALRSRADELHKAMEQAGFDLSGGLSFNVADDRGGQQQQGQAWQDQGEAAGRAFRGQAFRAALDTAGDAAEAATTGALRLRRGVTAGLDVRI